MSNEQQITITGRITLIKPTQRVSEKFSKREIVIDTGGDYPQVLAIEFSNKNIDRLESVRVGDSVDVAVNIRGREWTSPKGEVRHFVSLAGWKIAKVEGGHQGGDGGMGEVPDWV